EEEDFVINPSIITFDGKILINGGKAGNGDWPPYYVGLYKFNSNLEYDSVYTMPRTYDSLCPHPIVSDTIPMPDNCIYVSLPEEPKVGELQPLKMYPNPASDYVSIELPEYAVTSDKNGVLVESRYRPVIGKCDLEVYDISGKRIYNETLEAAGRNHVIITSGWGAGIYLVELEQKGVRIASAKLVKR
ncbi:MAG: T9SS type A sorting domain-containing protein, partial [Bacteroidota bacterium]